MGGPPGGIRLGVGGSCWGFIRGGLCGETTGEGVGGATLVKHYQCEGYNN